MNPAKKFMLILAIASLVLWIGANVVLGGPSLGKDYLSENASRHEHYLEIIKGDLYKNYSQRPHLNGPGMNGVPESLQADIDFVEEYTGNPAFIEEEHRIAIRGYFFEFFNAALVVILVVRFASKPLANLLDEKVADLKERLDTTAQNRKTAELRIAEAKAKVADLPEEKQRVARTTEERIAHEAVEMEKANQQSLELMARELEERRDKERLAAATLVKRELVNGAIDSVIESYRQSVDKDSDHQSELLDQYLEQLEKGA
jgi:F-type H+-transporting ATPase subunit b